MTQTKSRKLKSWQKVAIGAAIVASLIILAQLTGALAKVSELTEFLQNALVATLGWIDSLGALAPIAYIAIYIVAAVLFISGAVLTLGSGVIFGVIQGSIYTSIAATLGATAAFLVGRYFARNWVAKKIEGNPRFKAIDSAVAKEGWKIVLLTRLSPIFPFVLLNYAYGITNVKLRDYFLASWAGMLPGTVMYVYIGSLAKDIATLGAESEAADTVQWIIRIVGFAATVGVTLYVTKVARKALNSQIAEEVNPNEIPEIREDETAL